MMKITQTQLAGVYIIEPKVFGDNRGYFMETYSKKKFAEYGLFYEFVQDNESYSSVKGTLRGLHFQKGEAAQAKLVYCRKGTILDVVVDLRKDSPTYLKWMKIELSAENKKQLLIPRGFAHGFLTVTDEVEFCYKVDNDYTPEMEGSLRWNDPDIGVDWGVSDPILSEKDKIAPYFKEWKEEEKE